jgi:DNA topoisomerase IA
LWFVGLLVCVHCVCIYVVVYVSIFIGLGTVGDHPPITPVSMALPHDLSSSDNARIYELVVRHFLATISPDAVYLCTKATFTGTLSKETFTVRGKRELSPGFLQIYRTCVPYGTTGSGGDGDENGEEEDGEGGGGGTAELPELEKGRSYRVSTQKVSVGATRAPGISQPVYYPLFDVYILYLGGYV